MAVEGKTALDEQETLAMLLEPVNSVCVGSEAEFENNIIENLDMICEGLELPPIKFVYQQKTIKADGFIIKPDIIIRHVDGTTTIFEVKKTNEKHPATGTTNQMNAIGQLLLYGNVFHAKSGGRARLALIDNKIYYRTYCAFIGYNLPITLIEFQKNRVFVPYNGWRWDYGEDGQAS